MKIPFKDIMAILEAQYKEAMCEQYQESFEKITTKEELIAVANSDIFWCWKNDILKYFDNEEIEERYILEGTHTVTDQIVHVFGGSLRAIGDCRVYLYGGDSIILEGTSSCIVKSSTAMITAFGRNVIKTSFPENVIVNEHTKIVN